VALVRRLQAFSRDLARTPVTRLSYLHGLKRHHDPFLVNIETSLCRVLHERVRLRALFPSEAEEIGRGVLRPDHWLKILPEANRDTRGLT
jgi:hypothetical protein